MREMHDSASMRQSAIIDYVTVYFLALDNKVLKFKLLPGAKQQK